MKALRAILIGPILAGVTACGSTPPLGSRKPWILGGFILAMVSIYFLYVPEKTVGVPYFTTWFLLLFLAFTMIDIPHRAWGTEISRHYLHNVATAGNFSGLGQRHGVVLPHRSPSSIDYPASN